MLYNRALQFGEEIKKRLPDLQDKTPFRFTPPTQVSPKGQESIGSFLQGTKGLAQSILEFPGRPVEEKLRSAGAAAPLAFGVGLAADIATPFPGGKKRAVEKVASNSPVAFKGFKDLTTKFLDYAKGKTTLSKQEITDFARRSELKKGEADLLNRLGGEVKDNVSAQQFADDVKINLLELNPVKVKEPQYENISIGHPTFSNGKKTYEEVIFESPITTNGSSHYPNSKNYFAHARGDEVVEGGKKIWREQEIQSDALQKEGLERAKPDIVERVKVGNREFEVVRNRFGVDESTPKKFSEFQMDDAVSKNDLASGNGVGVTALDGKIMTREEAMLASKEAQKVLDTKSAELDKLTPFTNDRFGERILRERIKEKASKGYEKYRLPTGETIARIEGFSTDNKFGMFSTAIDGNDLYIAPSQLKPSDLKIGRTVRDSSIGGEAGDFVVTKVLKDGRFNAMPKKQVVKNLQSEFPSISTDEIKSFIENCL